MKSLELQKLPAERHGIPTDSNRFQRFFLLFNILHPVQPCPTLSNQALQLDDMFHHISPPHLLQEAR